MKNELSNIYTNQVLISESKTKNSAKSAPTVKGNKGATTKGELEGAAKAKPTKGATEKVSKDIKKPTEDKKMSQVKGKPTKMKESAIPQAFDQIFQSIINEEFGDDFAIDGDKVEDDLSAGDEYGDELGDDTDKSTEEETEEGGEEEAEESEDQVADDLKAVVAQLQDLISKLTGAEEEEEAHEEGEGEEEEKEEEETEVAPEKEEEAAPYEESLDLKGTLSELSKSLGQLLQKKDNKVKGTLGKAKGGKASEGNIPEQDGTPKAFNPDIKKLQNPKGANTVSTIKKGEYLFK